MDCMQKQEDGMPYIIIQTKAPVFMRYKGRTVYRIYRHDDADSGVFRTHTYTFDPIEGSDACVDGTITFDVRDLSTWLQSPHPPYLLGAANTVSNRDAWRKYLAQNTDEKSDKTAIRAALDSGELSARATRSDVREQTVA